MRAVSVQVALSPRSTLTVAIAALFASAAIACSGSDEVAGPSKPSSSDVIVGDGGSSATSSPAGGGANASAGATAVQTRGCGTCHTPQGAPELSGATVPLPNYPVGVELWAPNLTPDPETGIGTWTDGQLRLAIREGIDKDGLVMCPQMQHYRTMPDDEVDAIIKYLRALPPVKHAVKDSICPPLKR